MSSGKIHGITWSFDGAREREDNPHELSKERHDISQVSAESLHASKKLRSKVWRDFKKVMLDGNIKAICNHCKKTICSW